MHSLRAAVPGDHEAVAAAFLQGCQDIEFIAVHISSGAVEGVIRSWMVGQSLEGSVPTHPTVHVEDNMPGET